VRGGKGRSSAGRSWSRIKETRQSRSLAGSILLSDFGLHGGTTTYLCVSRHCMYLDGLSPLQVPHCHRAMLLCLPVTGSTWPGGFKRQFALQRHGPLVLDPLPKAPLLVRLCLLSWRLDPIVYRIPDPSLVPWRYTTRSVASVASKQVPGGRSGAGGHASMHGIWVR
jgi:hypothetical protein